MADSQAQFNTALSGRRAGILLHPSSLPGNGVSGTIGAEAHRFVDFLAASGIGVWQVLPLTQPHDDGSPYQCMSVHAGNVRLICLKELVDLGWLDVDSGWAAARGHALQDEHLDLAYQGFLRRASNTERDAFHQFRILQMHWLDDYALFLAIKARSGGKPWWEWETPLRDRHEGSLKLARNQLARRIDGYCFQQFVFHRQWSSLRQHANSKGVRLFGDMPIFVAQDSADVWVHRDLFDLDATGQPLHVAGVPPDYFSSTGQRWGNPHYRWDVMESQGFGWWIERIASALDMVDLIRIDHFRGFEAFWSIPAHEPTAIHGHWVPAPGRELFDSLRAHFGGLPLVAEDLGIVTPGVEALRDDNELPGMKILQFAFDSDHRNPYLPHNHVRNCVVYTGTHDNNTTLGWFEGLSPAFRQRVMEYLGHPSEAMPWPLIRSALASVSDLAVIPMQDILALDGRHRMNTPGTSTDNWSWRFGWDQVPVSLPERLRCLLEVYGRC